MKKRNVVVRTLVCRCLGSVLLFGVGAAHALNQDRIQPYVGLGYTYYSNVYYLDKNAPEGTFPFLKNNQFSDQALVGRLGVNADLPYSLQRFLLRAEVNENRYITYDSLNYTGYRGSATWLWASGNTWDGDLGYSYNRAGTSFIDFVTFSNVRNIATTQEFFGSAMYRVIPDLKLRVAARQTSVRNTSEGNRFAVNNFDTTSFETGPRYYSKGGDNYVGLNFRLTNGNFPNRQPVGSFSTVSNSFRQYDFEGVVDWQTTGLSRLKGSVGWTNRLHDEVSQRNFTGITGRIDWSYAYSGSTYLNVAVFRDLSAFTLLTSNYVVSTGFTVGPRFAVSDKLSWQISYDYRRRRYEGDPQFILFLDQPVRKDTNQSLSLGISWTPTRNTLLSTDVAYQTRNTNQQNFDFRAYVFSINGQVSF